VALVTDIADAVVAELAGGTFSETFTPQRRVLPEHELAELTDLQVTVVPRGVEITGASRALSQHDVQVDVGVQKKIGRDTDSEVASLLGLVDEIVAFLKRRPLQSTPQAVWVRTTNDPVYSPDHLAEQRTFTSVLTITYRVMQ
jgi:hypothetical protein